MIQHGILDLESVYDILGPEDEDIQVQAAKVMDEAKETLRKMNIVSTKDRDKEDGDKNEKKNDSADGKDEAATVTFPYFLVYPLVDDIIGVLHVLV